MSFGADASGLPVLRGFGDQKVGLWNAQTGLGLSKVGRAFNHGDAVAMSGGGRWLVVAQGSEIEIADVGNHRPARSIADPSIGVRSVTFSPTGNLIATGLSSGDVVLWDPVRGEPVRSLQAHSRDLKGAIHSVGFTSNGNSLLTAGDDGSVLLWDLASPGPPQSLQTLPPNLTLRAERSRLAAREELGSERPEPPTGLTACPDGNCSAVPKVKEVFTSAISARRGLVAYGGFYYDATLKKGFVSIVDSATHEEIGSPIDQENGSPDVTSLSFSPDGSTLVVGDSSGALFRWYVDQPKGTPGFRAHNGPINSVQFSPDGASYASAGVDGMVKVWEPATGRLLHTLTGHKSSVLTLAFSPDGRKLALGSVDDEILIWDLRSEQV